MSGVSQSKPRTFRNLFLGLVVVLLLPPFLRQAFPGASMLGPAIFVFLVTRTLFEHHGSRLRRAVMLTAMAAVALRGARLAYLVDIQHWWLALLVHLLTVVGFVFVVYEVLSHVLAAGPVDSDRLYAAVSAYLLIGIGFATLYEALHFWKPDAFNVALGERGQADSLVYFSLVTLSTVGYGDVLAKLPEARVLAVFEAIFGQLYLAVLMARLVGLHLTHSCSVGARTKPIGEGDSPRSP